MAGWVIGELFSYETEAYMMRASEMFLSFLASSKDRALYSINLEVMLMLSTIHCKQQHESE